MRRLLAPMLMLSSSMLGFAGCAVEGDLPAEESTEERSDAIYGGVVDTTHDAVVFLYDQDQGAACSGTIIAVNGTSGYVLTAGHCSGMDFVMMADNVDDCFGQGNAGCQGVFNVVQDQVHPSYNGDAGAGYDFRMIRFSGANASLPVIPATSNPDGVSVGSQFTVYGYGVTATNQNNSQRRSVVETVTDLDSLLIIASQSDGTGSCSGDSGGPAVVNGKVAGVVSFGDQNCTQYGAYGRVQQVYNGFIAPFIGAPVTETCDTCFDSALQPAGACGPAYNTCVASQDCTDFSACVGACNNSQSCINTCFSQHPTGSDQYIALIDCGCNACTNLCAAECGGSSSSTGVGPGATSSSTGAGVGGGGDGGAGEGGADSTSSGGGKKKNKGNGTTTTTTTCSYAPPAGGQGGSAGWIALGGLALVAARRSRRRVL